MTPTFKELFSLYGFAALSPTTRLLHRRVAQLELENQMLEQAIDDERERSRAELEKRNAEYLELQERVFVRKENLQPLTDQKPIKISKPKASKIRQKIAEMKRAEDAYYNNLAEASQ